MGAGDFPASMGGAGFDPPFILPSQASKAYPQAILFDPVSRTYPQDATGAQIAIDPVDQKAAILLGIEQSGAPANPDFFQKLRQVLNRIPASRQQDVAFQEVSRVLATMIAAGDIDLESVVVQTVARGSLQVGVNYENLRAGTSPPTLMLGQ